MAEYTVKLFELQSQFSDSITDLELQLLDLKVNDPRFLIIKEQKERTQLQYNHISRKLESATVSLLPPGSATKSRDTSVPRESRKEGDEFDSFIGGRIQESKIDFFVNGHRKENGFSAAVKEATTLSLKEVCEMICLDMDDTGIEDINELASAFGMLSGRKETEVQQDPDFMSKVYNYSKTAAIDTHCTRCIPMIATRSARNNTESSTNTGMPDATGQFPHCMEFKGSDCKMFEGVLQSGRRLCGFFDLHTIFKRMFVVLVDKSQYWFVYLYNDHHKKQPELHYFKVNCSDLAALWFITNRTAHANPQFIYNDGTAELLSFLKRLGVPWQYSLIQLLAVSSSKVFKVTPGSKDCIPTTTGHSFAVKVNPNTSRFANEVVSLMELGKVYDQKHRTLYACAYYEEHNSDVKYFQGINHADDGDHQLRTQLQEWQQHAILPIARASTQLDPPMTTAEDIEAAWFTSGELAIPPPFLLDNGTATNAVKTNCIIMHVGEAVKCISKSAYDQISEQIQLAKQAKRKHTDIRRCYNLLWFTIGGGITQLIDWDLSVGDAEAVLLPVGSAQRQAAPVNIRRQLRANTEANNGVERDAHVEWDYSDDLAMVMEYMMEKYGGDAWTKQQCDL